MHGGLDARSSKASKFRSSHMRKMKSMASWTLDEQAPSYSKKPLPQDPLAGENKQPLKNSTTQGFNVRRISSSLILRGSALSFFPPKNRLQKR
jgi:hypothetical protein